MVMLRCSHHSGLCLLLNTLLGFGHGNVLRDRRSIARRCRTFYWNDPYLRRCFYNGTHLSDRIRLDLRHCCRRRFGLPANACHLDRDVLCKCRSWETSDPRFRFRNRAQNFHRHLHRADFRGRDDRCLLNNHRESLDFCYRVRLLLNARFDHSLRQIIRNRLRFRAGILGACNRNRANLSLRFRIGASDRERPRFDYRNRYFNRNFLCNCVGFGFFDDTRLDFRMRNRFSESLRWAWLLSTSYRLGNDFNLRLCTHDWDRSCRRYRNRIGLDLYARAGNRLRNRFYYRFRRAWPKQTLSIWYLDRTECRLKIGAIIVRIFRDRNLFRDKAGVWDILWDKSRHGRHHRFMWTVACATGDLDG